MSWGMSVLVLVGVALIGCWGYLLWLHLTTKPDSLWD